MRLGGDGRGLELPDKPAGMHWRTYDRLTSQFLAAYVKGLDGWHQELGRMVELLSNVVDQVAQADGPSTSAFGNSVPADGTIFPSLKRTPSRSNRTRCGAFTFRHRPWAQLTSL